MNPEEQNLQAILDKHVLIGLTYLDTNGEVRDQVQFHGIITNVDESVITIRLAGSEEEVTVPPDLSAFEEAPSGEYTLRSTGEVIVNPDLLARWTIYPPNDGKYASDA